MERSNFRKAHGPGSRIAERLETLGYWRNGKPDVRRFCHDKGYLPQYIYGWLKGRVPSRRNLEKLARDLQTTSAWLLFGDAAGKGSTEHPASAGIIDLEGFRGLTERLAHLEAELDAVFRVFPDLYLLLDADGTILARKSAQVPARAGEAEPLTPRSLDAMFPAPVARQLGAGLARALGTRQLVTLEYSIGEGGEARFYEARFVPLAPAGSSGPRALQIVREITERKRAENAAAAQARVGREIIGTIELDEVLQWIVSTVLELFGVRSARIFRLEADSGTLVCVTTAGENPERWVGRTLERGQGAAGRAVLEGHTVRVPDVLALDLPAWFREIAAAENRRSAVGVPLRARGRLIGALGLARDLGETFSDDEVTLIESFADQAAVALDNARFYREARSLADQLHTLNHLNTAVSAALGLDEALHAIADAGVRFTGAALAAICVADEGAGTLNVRAHIHDGTVERLPATAFEIGSAAGWVAAHRQTLDIPDVFRDDRIGYPEWWREYQLTSFLGLPIIRGEALLGVLWLCGRRPFRAGPDQERLLASFVTNAAVAIRNARGFAESEARRRAATALTEVGRLLAETLDPGVLGQRITDSVRDLFGTQSAALYRLEPESGDLIGLAGSGDAGSAFRPGIVMPRGAGMAGLAIRERGPVFTADLLSDPRVRLPAEVRARIEPAPYRAVLAVPLVAKEQIIGSLSLADPAGRAFSPEDVRLVEAFAAQAALALENARLYAEATHRWREAEQLARVARTLTESLDVATVADHIAESALSLFDVHSCGIRLVDAEDGSLVSVGFAGRSQEYFPRGHALPAGTGLAGRAVREGKPVWSPDVLADPDLALHEDIRRACEATGNRAALAVPLRARGRIVGVLLLADPPGRRFSDADLVRADTLADQVALALDNARLYEQQRQRAAEQALSLKLAQGFLVAHDLEETVGHAAKVAAEALGADLCGVFLPEPDGVTLRLVGGVGWNARAKAGAVAPADTIDALEAPVFVEHGVVSGASVPMVAGERRVGMMGVYWRSVRSVSAPERRLLSLIANQTSVAVAQLPGRGTPRR